MTLKTTWPIKISGVLYPSGTEVRFATIEECRKVKTGKAPPYESTLRKNSNYMAIWLPNRPHPTIVLREAVSNFQHDTGTIPLLIGHRILDTMNAFDQGCMTPDPQRPYQQS